MLMGAASSGDLSFIEKVLDRFSVRISRRNFGSLSDGAMEGDHVEVLEYLVKVAKKNKIKIDDLVNPREAVRKGAA